MKFVKMHGAGNDYVVVDGREVTGDVASLSTSMCDRHFGIGADGLLLVTPNEQSDVRMRMYNPDGSEAEMCGNGIRCVAKYALERNLVSSITGDITVDTLSGSMLLTPVWRFGKVERARVAMGEPKLDPRIIPVTLSDPESNTPVLAHHLELHGQAFTLAFVSMGNPHAIAFIETPVDEFPLHIIGPAMETHPMFPKRVNFSIVNVKHHGLAEARVWERGVGETLACGSGACAICVAGRLSGYTGDILELNMPGGTLNVSWNGEGEVYLEGPVEEVYEGEWLA